jgi:hypothetical protein
MVVEGHHAFGRPCQVGHDEADAGAKLTRVLLDLRHHAARLFPALRLIGEARMESSHVVRWTPDRARQQMADLVLQHAVGREADRISILHFGLGLLPNMQTLSYTKFMRDNWLSNRIFTSYTDILDHCCFAWNALVDQPWKITSIGLRSWAHGS